MLLAFLQYGTCVFRSIQDLAGKYNVPQAAMAGAKRIFELLDTRPPDPAAERESEPEAEVPRREPSVEFRKVWFACQGKE